MNSKLEQKKNDLKKLQALLKSIDPNTEDEHTLNFIKINSEDVKALEKEIKALEKEEKKEAVNEENERQLRESLFLKEYVQLSKEIEKNFGTWKSSDVIEKLSSFIEKHK